MLILRLYGAGLRLREALSLTVGDVHLTGGIRTLRASKFDKTRLVPMGPDLLRALTRYATQRAMDHPAKPDAPWWVSRTATAVTRPTAENTVGRLPVRGRCAAS